MQTATDLYQVRTEICENLRVVNIQRTCVHDGPGIRTAIFFSGCNLRCLWCQNPEAIYAPRDAAQGAHTTISDIMQTVTRDEAYYRRSGGGVTLSGGDPLLQDPGRLIPLLERLAEKEIHVAVETSLHVP